MKRRNSSRDLIRLALLCAGLGLLAASSTANTNTVVFHLKGGDRIEGTILSESTNAVIVSTRWSNEIRLPHEQIEARETSPPLPALTGANPKTATAQKPAPTKEWRADAKLGMDILQGEKDRQIYYGQLTLKYARPYASKPDEFFRNTLDYRVDYGKTDGVESSDRMYGSNKTDFDISGRTFLYNYAGAGYDNVRKIDFQYELGPGTGLHLFRQPNFTANAEGGFSYQSQDRTSTERIEALYGKLGNEVVWRFNSQVTLSQRSAWLTRVDEPAQMQLRLEANLGLAVVKNVSFNLTAVEIYDTRPVPGVSPSEFQLRSSIGLAF
jgi:hypothetical protein